MKKLLYLLLIVFVGCSEEPKKEEVVYTNALVAPMRASLPQTKVVLNATALASVGGDLYRFFKEKVPDNSIVDCQIQEIKYDGTLFLLKRTGITIQGNGTTWRAVTNGDSIKVPQDGVGDIDWEWPRKRSQIALRACWNIVIKNLKIRGSNNAWDTTQNSSIPISGYNSIYEGQHGIDAEGVMGLTIDSCDIRNTWGDGVYVGQWNDGDGRWSYKVLMRENTIRYIGRQGVGVVGVKNFYWYGGYLGNLRRAVFDLEPDHAQSGSDSIVIRRAKVGPAQLLFIASGGQPAPVNNVWVDSCEGIGKLFNMTIGPSDADQIVPGRYLRTNWKITNNKSSDPTGCFNSPLGLITIFSGKNFTITNNSTCVTPGTAATMWTNSCGIDTVMVKTNNKFIGTPYQVWPPANLMATYLNKYVCDGIAPVPVDTIPKPPVDTVKPVDTVVVTPPVDSNKLIISIYSPVVQPYKVTTSTGSTTLKTGSLSIGENRIELTAYFKRYKTLRVYVGTKYYTVTKP